MSRWRVGVVLALLLATGYVGTRVYDEPAVVRLLLWFVGAAVVWDLVLGPLLALADTGLRAVLARARVRGVRPLNFVRVPALVSGTLLLVFAPLVLQRSDGVFRAKSGLTQDPYLGRWLAVTAVLFLLSTAAFAVRVLRSSPSDHPAG